MFWTVLSAGHNTNTLRVKTNIVGGAASFISGLGVLDVEDPEANGAMYENWASSVKDFPDVIDQKVPTTPCRQPCSPMLLQKPDLGLFFNISLCFHASCILYLSSLSIVLSLWLHSLFSDLSHSYSQRPSLHLLCLHPCSDFPFSSTSPCPYILQKHVRPPPCSHSLPLLHMIFLHPPVCPLRPSFSFFFSQKHRSIQSLCPLLLLFFFFIVFLLLFNDVCVSLYVALEFRERTWN